MIMQKSKFGCFVYQTVFKTYSIICIAWSFGIIDIVIDRKTDKSACLDWKMIFMDILIDFCAMFNVQLENISFIE